MASPGNTFLLYSAFFLGGALLLAPTLGIGVLVAAGVAVYLMLAATNAIERGERKSQKQLRDAQDK